MIRLPDPDKYEDPIRYFRDCHGVVGSAVDELEKLLKSAREHGVSKSFAANDRWKELLDFFVHVAPMHERDEEKALFPIVIDRVPHTGFQSKGSASRFIHDQHEGMQERSQALLSLWKAFLAQKTLTAEDEAKFLEVGTTLVSIYREHIATENGIIYTVANDNLLTPVERIAVMMLIREQHSDKTMTPFLGFADSPYDEEDTSVGADAVSESELETDEEEPDEDES